MCPKSNTKWPYKMQKRRRHRHNRESDMKTEVEVAFCSHRPRNAGGHQKLEETVKESFPHLSLQKEVSLAYFLISDPWPPEL